MAIHLLLIDDSPSDRHIQSILLESGLDDFDIQITAIEQPLPNIEDYKNFDGVIIDYDLIIIKGLELAKEISEKLPNLPLVIYTGMELFYSEFTGAERKGVSYVLSKNKSFDTLNKMHAFCRDILRVKKALGRRRSIRVEGENLEHLRSGK